MVETNYKPEEMWEAKTFEPYEEEAIRSHGYIIIKQGT